MVVGLASFTASILDAKKAFHLQLFPHVTTHLQVYEASYLLLFLLSLFWFNCELMSFCPWGGEQLWRLGSHHFAFSNTSEFFVGVVLLYSLRFFERRYGSAKFAVSCPSPQSLPVFRIGMTCLCSLGFFRSSGHENN